MITIIAFFIVNYFFENQKLSILIGAIVVNLILLYANPKQFLVNFEINNDKVNFKYINSHLRESNLEISINQLEKYKIKNAGIIYKNSEITFFRSYNIEDFIVFNDALVFRLEKFCKKNNINLK
ncbi:hypothetical protein [Flavobacterium okayamense]|uniref:hypothetical protein n=1 Tax=Flavobacterium okayamense TaxID=2830782 RepID=UPI001C85515A|nr:hypothetical protein [Flavobacterium okayamense]